jgi:phosphohistidine swiveling domain-containing protein
MVRCAYNDSGFLYGVVCHEIENHVTWVAGIGTNDFQQGVETRVTEAKGIVDELFEEHLINQTNRTESLVVERRGLASGDALVARDRKDVNASSFRKTEPVNNGKGAGKAEPVG